MEPLGLHSSVGAQNYQQRVKSFARWSWFSWVHHRTQWQDTEWKEL